MDKTVTEWQIMFTMTSGLEDFYTEDEDEYNEKFQDLIDDGDLQYVEQCIRKDYVWNEELEDWDEDYVEVLYDAENYDDYKDTQRASSLTESKEPTYIVCSYYDEKLHGLEDELKTDDWSEVEDFAHRKLMQGNMLEIENTKTGKYRRINPDEYDETFDGEFIVRPEELEESKPNIQEEKYNVYTLSGEDGVYNSNKVDTVDTVEQAEDRVAELNAETGNNAYYEKADEWWEKNGERAVKYVANETPEAVVNLFGYSDDEDNAAWDMYMSSTSKSIALELYNFLGPEEFEKVLDEYERNLNESYVSYEEPYNGKKMSKAQWKEIYDKEINHDPNNDGWETFEDWWYDMTEKSKLIVKESVGDNFSNMVMELHSYVEGNPKTISQELKQAISNNTLDDYLKSKAAMTDDEIKAFKTKYNMVASKKTESKETDRQLRINYKKAMERELEKVQDAIANAGPGDISGLEDRRDFLMDKLNQIDSDLEKKEESKSTDSVKDMFNNLSDNIKSYLENTDNVPTKEIEGTLWFDITQEEKEQLEQFVNYIDTIPEDVWRKWDEKTKWDISSYVNNADRICRNCTLKLESKDIKTENKNNKIEVEHYHLEDMGGHTMAVFGSLKDGRYFAGNEEVMTIYDEDIWPQYCEDDPDTTVWEKEHTLISTSRYDTNKENLQLYYDIISQTSFFDDEDLEWFKEHLGLDNNDVADKKEESKLQENVSDQFKVEIQDQYKDIDLSKLDLDKLYNEIMLSAIRDTEFGYGNTIPENSITEDSMWDVCIGMYADEILKVFKDLGQYEKHSDIDSMELDVRFMEIFINSLIDYIIEHNVQLIDTDTPSHMYISESKLVEKTNIELQEEIEEKINNAIYQYLIKDGYETDESAKEFIKDYVVVKTWYEDMTSASSAEILEKYLAVEVRAELDYDDLSTLSTYLDKVVQKYDASSYFDFITGGTIRAYIQVDTRKPKNTKNNKKKTEGKEVNRANALLDLINEVYDGMGDMAELAEWAEILADDYNIDIDDESMETDEIMLTAFNKMNDNDFRNEVNNFIESLFENDGIEYLKDTLHTYPRNLKHIIQCLNTIKPYAAEPDKIDTAIEELKSVNMNLRTTAEEFQEYLHNNFKPWTVLGTTTGPRTYVNLFEVPTDYDIVGADYFNYADRPSDMLDHIGYGWKQDGNNIVADLIGFKDSVKVGDNYAVAVYDQAPVKYGYSATIDSSNKEAKFKEMANALMSKAKEIKEKYNLKESKNIKTEARRNPEINNKVAPRDERPSFERGSSHYSSPDDSDFELNPEYVHNTEPKKYRVRSKEQAQNRENVGILDFSGTDDMMNFEKTGFYDENDMNKNSREYKDLKRLIKADQEILDKHNANPEESPKLDVDYLKKSIANNKRQATRIYNKVMNKKTEAKDLYGEWIDLLDKIPANRLEDYKIEYDLYDEQLNGDEKPTEMILPKLIAGAKKYIRNKKVETKVNADALKISVAKKLADDMIKAMGNDVTGMDKETYYKNTLVKLNDPKYIDSEIKNYECDNSNRSTTMVKDLNDLKKALTEDVNIEDVNIEKEKEKVADDIQTAGVKDMIDTEKELEDGIKKEVYQFAKQQGLDLEKLRKQGVELETIADTIDTVIGDMVSKSAIEYMDQTNQEINWDFEIVGNDIKIVWEKK